MVLSAWFAGGVPLLPFPYLRMGVLPAKVSPEFVGYEGGLGCPSWFVILFLCLLVHHLFSGVGVVFGHALVALPVTPGFGLF